MPTSLLRAGVLSAAVIASTTPVTAALPTQKVLPLTVALTIAQTAYHTCVARGYQISVHVLDRSGQTVVALRGDGANPHTFENSRRKAYTALTFRASSAQLAKNLTDPAQAANAQAPTTLPNIIAIGGGLPIKVGNEMLGAVGVSGAPGADLDEACAKAAIDKVEAELK